MLDRFRIGEITPMRIFSALMRRINDVPDWIAWNSTNPHTIKNKQLLKSYKNLHKGQRYFVIANGPSLKKMDLSPLSNEYTIGMNRIYLLFDQINFKPSFYICINELVLDEFAEDIQKLTMPKFLNWNRRNLFDKNDSKTIFLRYALGIQDFFGFEPEKIQFSGGTVTFASLQLAFFMGFQEVIIIGLDHNYSEKGTPSKVEIRKTESDESHFHPNYFPKGIKWQLPDLLRSEVAYKLAKTAFENDGRKILDATIGGKCPVFEKIDFEKIFSKKEKLFKIG